jgi:hypothetical protein
MQCPEILYGSISSESVKLHNFFSFVECKTPIWQSHEIYVLAFGLTAMINEPLEVGMGNLVRI